MLLFSPLNLAARLGNLQKCVRKLTKIGRDKNSHSIHKQSKPHRPLAGVNVKPGTTEEWTGTYDTHSALPSPVRILPDQDFQLPQTWLTSRKQWCG